MEEGEGEGELLLPPDQDLSASEKKMLLRIRTRNRLTKAERSSMRRLKRRKERQRREEEREILQARYSRHRSANSACSRTIPPPSPAMYFPVGFYCICVFFLNCFKPLSGFVISSCESHTVLCFINSEG